MWKRPPALLFVFALITFGCGGSDSRQNFVGTYNTTSVDTLTWSGGTRTTTSTGTMTIVTSSQGSNKIVAPSPECNFTATVNSDTSFTVDPVQCPPFQSSGCTIVLNVTQGSGTRSGNTLSITLSGTFTFTVCASVTGTFTQMITATKV